MTPELFTAQDTPKQRFGNFTSSEIYKLIGCGKRDMTAEELARRPKTGKGSKTTTIDDINSFSEAGLTYINERILERRLQLPLDLETYSKPTSWGNLCELYMMNNHELMSLEYEQRPNQSIFHPEFPYWCGRPDARTKKVVADIKSPYSRRSFCQMLQPIVDGFTGMDAMTALVHGYTIIVDGKEVEKGKYDEGANYYWQLVSNACILGLDVAQLIIYMPYESELPKIMQLAGSNPDFRNLALSDMSQLPFIKDYGFYNNKTVIEFTIPQADKDFLTSRVKLAGSMLK